MYAVCGASRHFENFVRICDPEARLRHGEYVLAEVSCQDAPFAAIVSCDGKGFDLVIPRGAQTRCNGLGGGRSQRKFHSEASAPERLGLP
jgi:hypothetical protein